MKVFYSDSGEALEQLAQINCGFPIPGRIKGKAGWGHGQADTVCSNPAFDRGDETR